MLVARRGWLLVGGDRTAGAARCSCRASLDVVVGGGRRAGRRTGLLADLRPNVRVATRDRRLRAVTGQRGRASGPSRRRSKAVRGRVPACRTRWWARFYHAGCCRAGLVAALLAVLACRRLVLRHLWHCDSHLNVSGRETNSNLFRLRFFRKISLLVFYMSLATPAGVVPTHYIYLSQIRHRPPTLSVLRSRDGVDEPEPLERAREERRQIQRPRRRQVAVVHQS